MLRRTTLIYSLGGFVLAVLAGLLVVTVLVVRSQQAQLRMLGERMEAVPSVETRPTQIPNRIVLRYVPITFELPAGYWAYESAAFEGGFGNTIYIGKERAPGFLENTAVIIYIREASDAEVEKVFNRIETIEEYAPELIQLFGNKAVRNRSIATEDGRAVFGFLRPDQTNGTMLSVHIVHETYGGGKEPNVELFEQVLQSLTLKQ